jgi:GntP family gluconate:H+ symporter
LTGTAYFPFLILLLGLVIVIGGIVLLRLHAFLALIAAALVVSLLAPGAWGDKVARVAEAFGDTAAGVGIVIALAAIVGAAMTASGSADRIVTMFLGLLGEKRGATALMASGFTLSIPVFFDTVFYLLVPLVRSMYRRTQRHYVLYLMAVATAATAHALVPPTPGPLVISQTLGVDLGLMILFGILVGAPAAIAGLGFAKLMDRRMPAVTPPEDAIAEAAHMPEQAQPGLARALAPLVLATVAAGSGIGAGFARAVLVLGNPNLALFLSAAIALATLAWRRREDMRELATTVEHALMSGGMIVLITAAGGAFGGMLRAAGLADAVQQSFGAYAAGGLSLLLLAFGMSALIKFAQGSSTAAMIVTSAMFAAMLSTSALDALGYHPVYLALAIGSGSLVGSWMNDSGFWIFAKMGGLTEAETLRTWTPLLAVLGSVAMALTLLLALLAPTAFGLG